MVAWYERALHPVSIAEVDTPFGVMTIAPSSPEDGYAAYCELKEPVMIHRVLYILQGEFHLDRQTEEWRGGLYPRRVKHCEPTPYRPKTWELLRDCSPTPKAQQEARKFKPVFEKWAEDNFKLLMDGRNTAMQNLILRAGHRLDAAIEAINKRRQELEWMQNTLNTTGALGQEDMRLLNDLWGHHWKF